MTRLFGNIQRFDSALDDLIDPDSRLEELGRGFCWTEGPIWLPHEDRLLFSDIPRNVIFTWKEGEPVREWMQPSGYTGVTQYGAEPGSNGLTLDAERRLTLCEHGDRRVALLEHGGGKRTLADSFDGKRLNSPNDLVYSSDGSALYFSDPAYGFPGRYEETERRELPFCGVYRIDLPSRNVALLTDKLEMPNGLAFSPDESILYVSQSHPERAVWMAYPVRSDGSLDEPEVLYDVSAEAGKLPGLPDGFKLDEHGAVFATGPGGVYVFSAGAKLLGRIDTGGRRASNLAWGDNGSTLYITAHDMLCRIPTRTRAAVMPGA